MQLCVFSTGGQLLVAEVFGSSSFTILRMHSTTLSIRPELVEGKPPLLILVYHQKRLTSNAIKNYNNDESLDIALFHNSLYYKELGKFYLSSRHLLIFGLKYDILYIEKKYRFR